MYTVTPVVDQNLVHHGFGFLVGVVVMIIAYVLYTSFYEYFLIEYKYKSTYDVKKGNGTFKGWWKQATGVKIALFVFAIITLSGYYVSYIKEYPVPKNEQVVAELVDLDTKMVQKNFGSTKHPEWKSVQQGFLVYSTPDGYMTLPNNHLQIVHPKIILYKN